MEENKAKLQGMIANVKSPGVIDYLLAFTTDFIAKYDKTNEQEEKGACKQ